MKRILLFLLFASTSILSQEFTGWMNYSSKSNIREIDVSGDFIWAATDGGAYGYNISSGEFRLLTKSEGMSSQNLTSLEIDNNGRIWFGTANGTLNIYNPVNGNIDKIFDITNTEKSQKSINDIYHKEDTVYVAMDFGLSLIDANSFFFIETIRKFGRFTTEISVNSVSKNKRISVITSEGVAVSKSGITNFSAPDNWASIETNQIIGVNEINQVIEQSDGNYILGTDNGIHKINFQNNSLSDGGNLSLSGIEIIDIKRFLNLNPSGFYSLSPNEIFDPSGNEIGNVSTSNFTTFSISGTGEIYIGTENGLFENAGGSSINPNSPAGNTFNGIAVDQDNGVWVGSGSGAASKGIHYFDGESWINYSTANVPEFRTDRFYEIFVDSKNKVYASNWGQGFSTFSNGKFRTYYSGNTPMDGISNDPNFLVISGMNEDTDGNIWILNFQAANREHLSVLTTDSVWHNFRFDNPSIASDEILDHLVIDRFDTKWFTVFLGDRGLYYFNENNTFDNTSDDSYGFISTSDGLNSNLITALAIDKRGELWIGTTEGVNSIFSVNNPRASITTKNLLNQQVVTCIAVDPLNRKWIGTTEGIYVVSPDGTTLIEFIDELYSPDGIIRPLPDNNILSIAFNERTGRAYIGTDFGMTSFKTSAVAPENETTELFVYPNPFTYQLASSEITVSNLTEDTNIKILSISGDLINDSENGSVNSPGGSLAFWNGRDFDGNKVPSGIYLVVSYDEEAKNVSSAKVAIINQ